jgi:hypothetical protein
LEPVDSILVIFQACISYRQNVKQIQQLMRMTAGCAFEQVEHAEKAALGGEQPEPRLADEHNRLSIPITAEVSRMALGASVLPLP